VSMQVYREVELSFERGDQLARGGGAQQARHILYAENVRAGFHQLLGHTQIVV
jgi:hypothetical protein